VERLKLLASEPGIMSDAAALARAGFLSTSAAFALADALRHDTQRAFVIRCKKRWDLT
jgi:hypothetical protein